MCGIIGGYAPGIGKDAWKSALQCISHRGPDDQGLWEDGNGVALGNTRLAIQDLSGAGHQPMQTDDGRFTLVYNGELYNAAPVREALSKLGYGFRSTSDTEVLLQAWHRWGAGALQRVSGIYALAVFDQKAQTITIARDPVGVKPLYYYQAGGGFAFGSELKALLGLPFVQRSVRPEGFYDYLLLQWSPRRELPLRHFRKLMPGHLLAFDVRQPKAPPEQRPCYRLPQVPGAQRITDATQAVREGDALLQHVLKSQLISDAPVGFFFSGGLDSTLLAAMAARHRMIPGVSGFTIDAGKAMEAEGFGQDSTFAKQAAKALGIHTHIIPAEPDLLGNLDRMIRHLDEPQGDPVPLFVEQISRAAADRGIKVLISGAGADDVFSGYRRHQALRWMGVARGLGPLANAASRAWPKQSAIRRRLEKLADIPGNTEDQQLAGLFFWQRPDVVTRLFHPDLQDAVRSIDPYEPFANILYEESTPDDDRLNRALTLEMRTFLPHHNLSYTDKMGMAAGVEIRVPYVDADVIAWAATLAPGLKMKGSQTKYVLRRIAEAYLPREIIHRKKTGFGAPLRSLMTGPWKSDVEQRLHEGALPGSGVFDLTAIRALWQDTLSGRRDGAYTVFTLLAIESWLRQFAGSQPQSA